MGLKKGEKKGEKKRNDIYGAQRAQRSKGLKEIQKKPLIWLTQLSRACDDLKRLESSMKIKYEKWCTENKVWCYIVVTKCFLLLYGSAFSLNSVCVRERGSEIEGVSK